MENIWKMHPSHKSGSSAGIGAVILTVILTAGMPGTLRAQSGGESAQRSVALTSLPASADVADTVLVRFGDRAVITQRDFEKQAVGATPNRYDTLIRGMTQDKLLLLYREDHPDLVTEEYLEKKLDDSVVQVGLKSREELAQRAAAKGVSWDVLRERTLIGLIMTALAEKGRKLAEDTEYLRKRYEQNPDHFNGTHVRARHIQFDTQPYHTPEQKEAIRRRLEELRQEILSGKKKFEEAVLLSDCPSRNKGGNLGLFPRHLQITEPVADAAFRTPVGKLSEVFASELGFHFVEVLERKEGNRPFDHPDTRRDIARWLEQETLWNALQETKKRYPVVGVHSPIRTAYLAEREIRPATRPAGATTQPGGATTRPAGDLRPRPPVGAQR